MIKNAKRASPYFLRLSYLYESDYGLCAEEHFHQLLALEAKRALRSRTVPLLLLLDLTGFDEGREADLVLRNVTPVLFSSTREVDAKGWHRYPGVLGVLVADSIATGDSLLSARDAIVDRLRANLAKTLASSDIERIRFSCQTVPSSSDSTQTTPSEAFNDHCSDSWQGRCLEVSSFNTLPEATLDSPLSR
jgi:hypothetical protein